MLLKPFTGPGTTNPRRSFWDVVTSCVNSARKIAGANTRIDEHPGLGSVINFIDRCCSGGTTGACCTDGECTITTEAECAGNYLGNGTTCDGVDCTQGACCAEDGSCTVTTSGDCSGTYQGDGTTCDPNPCPQPTGACCNGSDCSIQTQSDCEGGGGTYQGDDTTCDPNPCPAEELGACCPGDGGDCYISTFEDCVGSGSAGWSPRATCDEVDCSQGGCCFCIDDGRGHIGCNCLNTYTKGTCEGDGGFYLGDGVMCGDLVAQCGATEIGTCCCEDEGGNFCGCQGAYEDECPPPNIWLHSDLRCEDCPGNTEMAPP